MIEFSVAQIQATIEALGKEAKRVSEISKTARNKCASKKNELTDTINNLNHNIGICQSEEAQAKTVRDENEALKEQLLSETIQIKQSIAENDQQISNLRAMKTATASDAQKDGQKGGDSSHLESKIQTQIAQLQRENEGLATSLQNIERKINAINNNNEQLRKIIAERHGQMVALKSYAEKLKSARDHLISTHDTLSFECKQLCMVLNNVIDAANTKLGYAREFMNCFSENRFPSDLVTVTSVGDLSRSLHRLQMSIYKTEENGEKLIEAEQSALKHFIANTMKNNAKNIEQAIRNSKECIFAMRNLANKLERAIEFLKHYEE